MHRLSSFKSYLLIYEGTTGKTKKMCYNSKITPKLNIYVDKMHFQWIYDFDNTFLDDL